MKGEQKLIKLKIIIIKAKVKCWWYNNYVGKEIEVTEFAYWNGARYPLNIKNFKELIETVNIYGENLTLHTSRDPNGSYYGSVKGGGPYWQIHLENTNWKMLERKEKLKKIEWINLK